MADEREVVIKIKSQYEDKGNVDAEKGLKKVETQAKKTSDAAQKGATQSGDAFSSMAKKIGATVASLAALKSVISFFVESVQLANYYYGDVYELWRDREVRGSHAHSRR